MFKELPARWSISIGGTYKELSLQEIVQLRAACDEVLEHRSELVERTVNLVCRKLNIERYELYSRDRPDRLCLARYCVWHILRQHGMGFSEIAKQFRKDHATIINGLKRLKAKMKPDSPHRKQLAWLENETV